MLPNSFEPLVLADGTIINPDNGHVMSDDPVVKVPNTSELQREIVASRIRISDLPVPPKQMNTLSVILSYSLQGISDNDIANVLLIDKDKIITIKESDPYKELQATIVKNITESDLSNVRGLFVQHSRGAAQVMFDVVTDPEMGIMTKMNAAKDILDRAGQRPVDVVEHRHKMEGGLTIEYVEKKDDLPVINIEKDF
jgi:hypothetical protein|tara:strand:+ start:346 stop:936 length:591 start_codon:yes stop_codon:yes gene_type:complete